MLLEKPENHETLAELDRLGGALGEGSRGWFTHVKQGRKEWWTFHLAGFVCLVVHYTYTAIATKVYPMYQRDSAGFDCFEECFETAPSYPSDGTPTVIHKHVLSLEEVLKRLQAQTHQTQPARAT